ncbi:hypothetical protein [Aquella oligotrophica]|uniref:Uncharacterized protein n=1 Tax=Aquella oligotrophica TaxID=2067065 RepID=A0A2I7N509_9NEIS|nr:hypothetical protein [Aquella oligotrophica]AUR51549.1 hypothetical protein CUN60_04340 [Aquella oligotrophica]
MQQLTSNTQINHQLNKFLKGKNVSDQLIKSALNEISELANEVNKFQDEIAKSSYSQVLAELTEKTIEISEEAELLEYIIPKWQELRGSIISNKPIDEFYYELEHYLLLKLIKQMAETQIISDTSLKKMREIVRRYSVMPNFWQILCLLNGDSIINAYTF